MLIDIDEDRIREITVVAGEHQRERSVLAARRFLDTIRGPSMGQSDRVDVFLEKCFEVHPAKLGAYDVYRIGGLQHAAIEGEKPGKISAGRPEPTGITKNPPSLLRAAARCQRLQLLRFHRAILSDPPTAFGLSSQAHRTAGHLAETVGEDYGTPAIPSSALP